MALGATIALWTALVGACVAAFHYGRRTMTKYVQTCPPISQRSELFHWPSFIGIFFLLSQLKLPPIRSWRCPIGIRPLIEYPPFPFIRSPSLRIEALELFTKTVTSAWHAWWFLNTLHPLAIYPRCPLYLPAMHMACETSTPQCLVLSAWYPKMMNSRQWRFLYSRTTGVNHHSTSFRYNFTTLTRILHM